MKKIVFTQLMILFVSVLFAQTVIKIPSPLEDERYKGLPIEEVPFSYVEQMPEFPGSEVALNNFLSKNIVYPELELKNKIQGTVFVRFVVLEDGSIGNIDVVKTLGNAFTEEAIRVVKLMPNFIPGTQQGKPVKVYYNLPINFKL